MTLLLALVAPLLLMLLLAATIRADGYGHRPPPRSHRPEEPQWRRWAA